MHGSSWSFFVYYCISHLKKINICISDVYMLRWLISGKVSQTWINSVVLCYLLMDTLAANSNFIVHYFILFFFYPIHRNLQILWNGLWFDFYLYIALKCSKLNAKSQYLNSFDKVENHPIFSPLRFVQNSSFQIILQCKILKWLKFDSYWELMGIDPCLKIHPSIVYLSFLPVIWSCVTVQLLYGQCGYWISFHPTCF